MAADESWRTEEIDDLLEAVLRLESLDEAERFFRDLCTLGELHDMAQRWAVVRMLHRGLHYARISQETGASTATITRIASWLNHGEGGYRLMLDRVAGEAGTESGAPQPASSAPASSPKAATRPAPTGGPDIMSGPDRPGRPSRPARRR